MISASILPPPGNCIVQNVQTPLKEHVVLLKILNFKCGLFGPNYFHKQSDKNQNGIVQ
jgi:hypothetical protein